MPERRGSSVEVFLWHSCNGKGACKENAEIRQFAKLRAIATGPAQRFAGCPVTGLPASGRLADFDRN